MLLSLINRFRTPRLSDAEIRAKLDELLEYEADTETLAALAEVVPGFDPDEHARHWKGIISLVQWIDELDGGAHPGFEEDGHDSDRETMLEQAREELEQDLTALTARAARPARRSPLARLLGRAA